MLKLGVNLSLILTLLLVTLVVSPTILPARGVIAYSPGVMGGQWALYKQLYIQCTPPNPSICGSQSFSVDYSLLRIVSVYNAQVTANFALVFSNGTGTNQGILEDVATGYSNLTFSPIPQPLPFSLLVTAKNLQAGDHLTLSSPSKFNTTISERVAGQDRMVNVLNVTQSYGSLGYSSSTSTVFEFDQETGVFVNLEFSISYVTAYGSVGARTAFGMVDNNIWSSPSSTSYPDFGISAAPTEVTTVQTSHTNSTVTITRMRGFNATVVLTAGTSTNGILCTLSPTKLTKGGTDKSILSCTGSPGTYTVTVTGNSGYSTHSIQTKINLGAAATTSSSTSSTTTIVPSFLGFLLNPSIDIAIIATGIIITLAAILLTRRKPKLDPQATI